MKKRLLLLCFFGSSLFALAQPTPSTGPTPFKPGNLVIYRFGDESTDNKAGLVPAFLDEITPAGEFVRSIPMPTKASGDNRAFMGGVFGALRGDLLSLSADGRYLSVIGVDGPRQGKDYGKYPKVIARISGNGEVNTSTVIPTASIGSTGRNVVSKDGTGFYTTGGTGGVRYVPFGFNKGVKNNNLASSPRIGGAASGFALTIFNNQLYYIEHPAGTTTNLAGVIGRLSKELPTPTADMKPEALLSPLHLPELAMPNQFVLLDQNSDNIPDLLYVIEIPAAGQNSIVKKYSFIGDDKWRAMGTFTHKKLKDGKSIAARVVGKDVQIFITTAPSAGNATIVRINDPLTKVMDDNGYTVSQNYTDINTPGLVTTIVYASLKYKFNNATDGSTVNFRSVAFAPIL